MAFDDTDHPGIASPAGTFRQGAVDNQPVVRLAPIPIANGSFDLLAGPLRRGVGQVEISKGMRRFLGGKRDRGDSCRGPVRECEGFGTTDQQPATFRVNGAQVAADSLANRSRNVGSEERHGTGIGEYFTALDAVEEGDRPGQRLRGTDASGDQRSLEDTRGDDASFFGTAPTRDRLTGGRNETRNSG